MKIAILSNVNVDMLSQKLAVQFSAFPPQGYGNSFAMLLDPQSDLNIFSPQAVYYLMDLHGLTASCGTLSQCFDVIDQWFSQFEACLRQDTLYFVSDALPFVCLENDDELYAVQIQNYWNQKLVSLLRDYTQVHCFPLSPLAAKCGKTFYSTKLWYMGKIPFSTAAFKIMTDAISTQLALTFRPSRKVLLLDLDNTLWGGILGEDGMEGVLLSDDGQGAVYRDVQRLIKRMQQRGVLLAICSKNNASDVDEMFLHHPHMVLQKEDFVSLQINWDNKPENVQKIAKELNLGLSSFVFVDDSPAERDAMKRLLPEVEVPNFPSSLEQYPGFYLQLYEDYFRKWQSTGEDLVKTKQYADQSKRLQLAQTMDYDTFIQSLELKIQLVLADGTHMARLEQLLHKTNQFNLTTKRYTLPQLEELKNSGWLFYIFHASDKFGDYGIIAAVLVDTTKEIPRIDTFAMSCRIMGKRAEHFMIDYVEQDLLQRGYAQLQADYIPTAKNHPVSQLYPSLGYEEIEKTSDIVQSSDDMQSFDIVRSSDVCYYQIDLRHRPKRLYYVK